MINRKLFYAAAATALTLSACGQADTAKSEASVATQSAGLSIESLQIIPPLPGRNVAVGTFTMTNTSGADDVLLSASSPISGRVELHTHIKEGDVMKMRRVDSVDIAAGQTVEFKRGGYHLMMFDAAIDAGVMFAPVTLTFKNAGEIELPAKLGGKTMSGHSGH